MAHNPRAAAARLREQASAEGWAFERLVAEIQSACGISPLAAHRHARGWTLENAVTRINSARAEGDTAETTVQQLSKWERGDYVPKAAAMTRLCRTYGTTAEQLGFVMSSTGPDQTVILAQTTGLGKRTRVSPGRAQSAAASVEGGLEEVMDELEEVRLALGETLGREYSDTAISFLERRVDNYDLAFRVGTSTKAILDVSKDLRDARKLLDGAHSPDSTNRLLRVIAKLAGMLGIALLHVGDPREGDQWLLTAQLAAEKTDDRQLRAWVSARMALTPLYYGNRADALTLAEQALALAGQTKPTGAGVRALTIKARVLAGTGQRAGALAAADLAQEWYTQLSGQDVSDGLLGMRPIQIAGNLSEVYTRTGNASRAMQQAHSVLSLYEGAEPTPEGCLMPEGCLEYALASFTTATNLVKEGEIEHACALTSAALLRLPAVCCTLMVVQQARTVAMLVPEQARTTAAWQELRDVLAFRK